MCELFVYKCCRLSLFWSTYPITMFWLRHWSLWGVKNQRQRKGIRSTYKLAFCGFLFSWISIFVDYGKMYIHGNNISCFRSACKDIGNYTSFYHLNSLFTNIYEINKVSDQTNNYESWVFVLWICISCMHSVFLLFYIFCI